jgi:hypothetical protein
MEVLAGHFPVCGLECLQELVLAGGELRTHGWLTCCWSCRTPF